MDPGSSILDVSAKVFTLYVHLRLFLTEKKRYDLAQLSSTINRSVMKLQIFAPIERQRADGHCYCFLSRLTLTELQAELVRVFS